MADQTPGEVAREEAARQGVWLVAMAVAIPLLTWIERQATQPDALKTLKMRGALAAERFCMDAARNWAGLADRARAVYEAERA